MPYGESLHILLGTSACLQWLCHSGERTVARGPLVFIVVAFCVFVFFFFFCCFFFTNKKVLIIKEKPLYLILLCWQCKIISTN